MNSQETISKIIEIKTYLNNISKNENVISLHKDIDIINTKLNKVLSSLRNKTQSDYSDKDVLELYNSLPHLVQDYIGKSLKVNWNSLEFFINDIDDPEFDNSIDEIEKIKNTYHWDCIDIEKAKSVKWAVMTDIFYAWLKRINRLDTHKNFMTRYSFLVFQFGSISFEKVYVPFPVQRNRISINFYKPSLNINVETPVTHNILNKILWEGEKEVDVKLYIKTDQKSITIGKINVNTPTFYQLIKKIENLFIEVEKYEEVNYISSIKLIPRCKVICLSHN